MKTKNPKPSQKQLLSKTILFFETSENNEEDLLRKAFFAKVPRNNYGRPILEVPPMRS